MKKILSILAISLVSLNFVSCREDNMDLETETSIPQARTANNKSKVVADNIVSDSIETNNVALREEADPAKDPPRDRTSW